MMLVGNKVDLEESGEREVSTETGETFAKVRQSEIVSVQIRPTALIDLQARLEMKFRTRYDNVCNAITVCH